MIHSLTGTVTALDEQRVIIDLGPLCLSLHVPNPHVFELQKQCTLLTYLHWHQEQGPTLFGFATELERTIFLLVISCSGLGPKMGLSILKDLGPATFIDAVSTGNEAVLSNVSGIGAKKAEQIIVQLKHKVSKLIKSGAVLTTDATAQQWVQINQVLESLNYSRAEINGAMKYLGEQFGGQALPFDQLMRHALSFLSKRV